MLAAGLAWRAGRFSPQALRPSVSAGLPLSGISSAAQPRGEVPRVLQDTDEKRLAASRGGFCFVESAVHQEDQLQHAAEALFPSAFDPGDRALPAGILAEDHAQGKGCQRALPDL